VAEIVRNLDGAQRSQQPTRHLCFWLLQLRVLRLGLLQDGDVGVGVSPQGEEILQCRADASMPLGCNDTDMDIP
jgi:hypothetical protein